MSKAVDMTGKRFGSLTAIRCTGERNAANNLIWEFRCDCGETLVFDGHDARSGKRHTCVTCSQRRSQASCVTHGMSYTSEWKTWREMKTRCYNQRSTSYPNYGGRGIRICERWLESFDNFFADMGQRPLGMSIDRRDTNGDYSPENCRWATVIEQANNKRNSVRVTIGGVTKNVHEWAAVSGIRATTLYQRVQAGWAEHMLLSPLQKQRRSA